MRKVIVSVAPVRAGDPNVDPMLVAQDVIRCYEAGASMVHLHVRDRQGNLTEDLTCLKETVEEIRKKTDMVIEVSTGGVSGLNIQQRCAPLEYSMVELASLNVGSINLGEAVYQNPLQDVRYCMEQIKKHRIIPDIEVFELGMVHSVLELQKEIPFDTKALYSIVLGHFGAAPANMNGLWSLKQALPQGALWGITHFGRKDYDIMAAAVAMGADALRIGFEDSNYLDEGTQVESNAPLIARAVQMIEGIGHRAATAQEARQMLGK